MFAGFAALAGFAGQGQASQLTVAEGYRVSLWAKGLVLPRVMVETASGDLIVTTYHDGRLLLVKKDSDGDGKSDGTTVLETGLNSPFGMVLEGGTLFVAEENRVSTFSFDGKTLSRKKTILTGLPQGGHVTRTLRRGPDGWLYLAIGSSCNRCIEKHPWRASIIRFKPGKKPQVFARGLRNTVGFDWHPKTGAMYGVNAGSDGMGDDVPPEELNLIEKAKHYGWPYIHGDGFKDKTYWKRRPKGANFVPPVHSFTAHSTPLSIRFLKLKPKGPVTALVARRGSWNRSTKSGYDVVMLTWQPDGSIVQKPFLAGFLNGKKVIGRPVKILQTKDGRIFVSDDERGTIYKIVAKNECNLHVDTCR